MVWPLPDQPDRFRGVGGPAHTHTSPVSVPDLTPYQGDEGPVCNVFVMNQLVYVVLGVVELLAVTLLITS